jgi:hypothetical protein
MQKSTRVFPGAPVSFSGQSLISHAGMTVLTGFINALGFRAQSEDRLGQFAPAGASHRPGPLVGSLAVMLAAGGEHVSDLDMLRSSPGVFGPVASKATVSCFFDRTGQNPEGFAHGFETLTRALRSRVWEAAGERNPALKATPAEPLIIDLDATLVTSHSDKENVAGTYKGGYGSPRSSPPATTADATEPGNPHGADASGQCRGQQRRRPHPRLRRRRASAPGQLLHRQRRADRGKDPDPHRHRRRVPEVPLAPALRRGPVLIRK